MELSELFEYRKKALKNKDFGTLCKCAIEIAKMFPGESDPYGHHSQEVAFFLGRINDRKQFEELIYHPYTKLPPSLRTIRSFEKEEKMFDLGQRYPFLEDEELDYLEELYCSSDTYDMINRMLYDQDEVLRRKLARFDESHFLIKNDTFSKKLCLDTFNALIQNEIEYNIQEVIDERYESIDDRRERACLFGYEVDESFSPIWVYNRRTNSIQIDKTDLSDRFLIPIYNFFWAQIKMPDAIDLYIEYFGEEVVNQFIYPALKKRGLDPSHLKWAAFCVPWYLTMETAVVNGLSLQRNDYRLLDIREQVAKKWLTFQLAYANL